MKKFLSIFMVTLILISLPSCSNAKPTDPKQNFESYRLNDNVTLQKENDILSLNNSKEENISITSSKLDNNYIVSVFAKKENVKINLSYNNNDLFPNKVSISDDEKILDGYIKNYDKVNGTFDIIWDNNGLTVNNFLDLKLKETISEILYSNLDEETKYEANIMLVSYTVSDAINEYISSNNSRFMWIFAVITFGGLIIWGLGQIFA